MAYNGNTIGELISSNPLENCSAGEINDAIREISRALSNDFNVSTITGSIALDKTHGLVLANATSGSITVNLPQATTVPKKRYIIKKIDASVNTVTIDPFGSETIDGQTTITLSSQYSSISIASNGIDGWEEIKPQNATNATNADKVDNYHASLTPSANIIPVTDTGGKLGSNWFYGDFIRDKARNLVIQNDSVANQYKINVTIDEIVLQDTSYKSLIARNVSVSANIEVSGLNGLDTGTEAVSTWYHIWLISNGTTVASLLSTSSTSPTMPSGYTYKAYLGAIYNDSSGNFITIYQKDKRVSRQAISAPLEEGGVVNLSTVVPSTTKKVKGYITTSRSTAGFIDTQIFTTSPAGGWLEEVHMGTNSATFLADFFSISLTTPPQEFYCGNLEYTTVEVYISGWEY